MSEATENANSLDNAVKKIENVAETTKLVRGLVTPDMIDGASDQDTDRSPGHDRDETVVSVKTEVTENAVVRELIIPEPAPDPSSDAR